MVNEEQMLNMLALLGLEIFSNRELVLFQIYQNLLLRLLPVIKVFWNTLALIFFSLFSSWAGFTACRGNKSKEE